MPDWEDLLLLLVTLPTAVDAHFEQSFIRHSPPVCNPFCTWTMWGPLGPVWGDPRTATNRIPLCGVRLVSSASSSAPSSLRRCFPVLLARETRHDVPRPGWHPDGMVQELERMRTDGGAVVPPEEGVPHPGSLLAHLPGTLAGRLHGDPHIGSGGQQCR